MTQNEKTHQYIISTIFLLFNNHVVHIRRKKGFHGPIHYWAPPQVATHKAVLDDKKILIDNWVEIMDLVI